MKGFQDQVLSWNGVDYTIRASDMQRAMKRLEVALCEETSVTAIQVLLHAEQYQACVISGYVALLNFAGCDVTFEEVRDDVQGEMFERNTTFFSVMSGNIADMINAYSPPLSRKLADLMESAEGAEESGDEEKKFSAGA